MYVVNDKLYHEDVNREIRNEHQRNRWEIMNTLQKKVELEKQYGAPLFQTPPNII